MGSGRKPLPAEQKLNERVTVNLTRLERQALQRLAGEKSEGSYLRKLLVRHLARRKK